MLTARQTFVVTRRPLATELLLNGFELEKIPNLRDETKPAWRVDLTPSSARFLRDYYLTVSCRPVPEKISAFLENEGRGE